MYKPRPGQTVVQFYLEKKMFEDIENWRRKQPRIPSRTQAIVTLVEWGLQLANRLSQRHVVPPAFAAPPPSPPKPGPPQTARAAPQRQPLVHQARPSGISQAAPNQGHTAARPAPSVRAATRDVPRAPSRPRSKQRQPVRRELIGPENEETWMENGVLVKHPADSPKNRTAEVETQPAGSEDPASMRTV